MHACMHAHAHAHTYMHTHTHTHPSAVMVVCYDYLNENVMSLIEHLLHEFYILSLNSFINNTKIY